MLGFHDGPPVTVHSLRDFTLLPRWLVQEVDHPIWRELHQGTLYKSCWDCLVDRRPRRVMFYRTHALGDLLMLVPVVKALRRALGMTEPVTIACEDRFVEAFKLMERGPDLRFIEARGISDYGFDLHFDLNYALEIDHSGGEASDHHRVVLYGRALGVEMLVQ